MHTSTNGVISIDNKHDFFITESTWIDNQSKKPNEIYCLDIKESIHALNANSPFKDAYKSDAPNFIPESTNKHTELSPSPERPKAKAPSMISNKNQTTAPNSQNSNSLIF